MLLRLLLLSWRTRLRTAFQHTKTDIVELIHLMHRRHPDASAAAATAATAATAAATAGFRIETIFASGA